MADNGGSIGVLGVLVGAILVIVVGGAVLYATGIIGSKNSVTIPAAESNNLAAVWNEFLGSPRAGTGLQAHWQACAKATCDRPSFRTSVHCRTNRRRQAEE